MDEPIVGVPEPFSMLPLLEFAGIKSATILCYPIVQQIADKVHAYTRPRPAGISTRVKDVIDILLIAEVQTFQRTSLHNALEATFSYYNTHPLPMILPDPPVSWMTQFRQLARTTDLAYTTPSEAVDAMRSLVEPALQGAGQFCFGPGSNMSAVTGFVARQARQGFGYGLHGLLQMRGIDIPASFRPPGGW